MNSSDDDDKFLYGSDEEQIVTNSKKKENNDTPSSKKRAVDTIETEISNNSSVKKQKTESFQINDNNNGSSGELDSEYSDSDSDSDIEIIVSKGSDPTRLDSKSIHLSTTTIGATTVATKATPSGDSISIATEISPQTDQTESGTAAGTVGAESDNKVESGLDMAPGSLDLDKDGLFDGQPIANIDPEVLKEKPWRKPGIDISDYFNYGFNEYTWMEYLDRQEKWREEYNPRKILMGLLSLQQQGKLDPISKQDISKNSNLLPTASEKIAGMPTMNNNMNMPSNAPQMMNPFPMFGGFPPFMPGMMPNMGQQSQGQQQQSQKK